jgi:hypothetical protein
MLWLSHFEQVEIDEMINNIRIVLDLMVIVYCTIYVTVYPIEFRSDQAKDYKIGICIHLQH